MDAEKSLGLGTRPDIRRADVTGEDGETDARPSDTDTDKRKRLDPRRTFICMVMVLALVLLQFRSYTPLSVSYAPPRRPHRPGHPPRPPQAPHYPLPPYHPYPHPHPPHCPFGGKTLAPANYTVVKGLFVQDEDGFNGTGYDPIGDSFGLLDKSPDRWARFAKHVRELNANADAYTTYKVLYVARHGEGWHNVAEAQYGTPAWNCDWSMKNGDGNITWGPDPVLTPLGEAQARAVNAGWKDEIRDGVPVPQALYSSPLRRAAQTLEITWGDILLNRGVRPVIKESLRESIGLHTCDLRSSKSDIAAAFPGFDFEPSFTEHDPLWDAEFQETEPQEAVRLRLALNEIFATDPRTFVGITAHGGVIGALFRAVGKNRIALKTGGFVPFVLKATSHPTATFEPIVRGQSATAPACTP